MKIKQDISGYIVNNIRNEHMDLLEMKAQQTEEIKTRGCDKKSYKP